MNRSKQKNLTEFYRSLNQYPLTDFVEAIRSTSDLNEREFYMTLLSFELKKRQHKVIYKGSELYNG